MLARSNGYQKSVLRDCPRSDSIIIKATPVLAQMLFWVIVVCS
jgi:hypothetical protein